jgi:hypothetical protein
MKIFTALMALLRGEASAPKTLDLARATLTDARSCLDKIGAMFTAAALDLDALLAKGDNALKEFVTELNTKVTTAEASVTEANGKVTAAEAKVVAAENKVSALNSQISAFGLLFASIGFKPAEVKGTGDAAPTAEQQATALQESFKAHVAGAVTQKAQEIGIPISKLPKATTEASAEETLAEIQAKLATCTDPVEGGRLAAKANKLRDQEWAARSSRN